MHDNGDALSCRAHNSMQEAVRWVKHRCLGRARNGWTGLWVNFAGVAGQDEIIIEASPRSAIARVQGSMVARGVGLR